LKAVSTKPKKSLENPTPRKKMKIKANALDIFNSLPDELLIQIAQSDPEALEELCMALTLEFQLSKEKTNIERKSIEN
jgi:hypothetical protein